jgi:methyl-accepting chemotaxis protein
MKPKDTKQKVKTFLTIGQRIVISFIVLFVLLSAFYFVYLYNNFNISQTYGDVETIAFNINKKTDELTIILWRANTLKEQFRLEDNTQDLNELKSKFAALTNEFSVKFNELDSLAGTFKEYQTTLYSTQKGFNDFQTNAHNMFKAHEQELETGEDFSSALLASTAQTSIENSIRNMNVLKEQADKITKSASNEVYGTMRYSNYVMLLIFSISLVFMILIGFNLYRSISIPTKKLANALHEIAAGDGDLTTKLRISSHDEIGFIVIYFNRFVEKLRTVITKVKQSVSEVAAATEEMSSTTQMIADNAQGQAASAEQVTATMEEIASGSDKIAGETQEQVSSLGSLNQKMESLSSVMDEVGTKVSETLDLTESITDRAIKGERSLHEMNGSMNKIISSSREIKNIVTIINDISEQINLLSLNASIEAARAGEQGRGFAVVADQISKLADETASSLKEIDNLISVNNTEINSGISGVQETTDLLSSVIDGFNNIKQMMNIINDFIMSQNETKQDVTRTTTDALDRSDIVKTSTEEQNIAVTEVVKSISDINDVSQSNAGGAVELAQSAKRLGTLAENLKAEVDFFKV